MITTSWNHVALKYATDKSSEFHNYMELYQDILQDHVVKNFLEIGVFRGGSVSMWAELFPDADIVGIDKDFRCKWFQTNRVSIVIADVNDRNNLWSVGTLYGLFDVIVDDGSHIVEEVETTFETLRPFLSEGGFYIIEDLDPAGEWTLRFAARWGAKIIPTQYGSLIVYNRGA